MIRQEAADHIGEIILPPHYKPICRNLPLEMVMHVKKVADIFEKGYTDIYLSNLLCNIVAVIGRAWMVFRY